MQRYKLTRSQSARLKRLLHMEYTISELANELDCGRRKIRTAIESGCPHRRTETGRPRIVGDEFNDWYQEILRRRKRPLGHNEVFCLGCKQAVTLPAEAEVHPQSNGVERLTASCPHCGSTVNRFRKAVTS
jgi:ribosomal protein L32